MLSAAMLVLRLCSAINSIDCIGNPRSPLASATTGILAIERMADSTPSPPRRPRDGSRSASPSPPRNNTRKSPSASPSRRPRDGSRSASPSPPRKKLASGTRVDADGRILSESGHVAGLQSAAEFGRRQREINREREEEMARLSAQLGNTQNETVLRQKVVQADGTIVYKKKDALTEVILKQAMDARKEHDVAKAQEVYAQGNVQKQQVEERAQYLAELANAPFARMADDAELERELKSAIHNDDPMAKYFHQKREKREKKDRERSKKKSSSGNNFSRDINAQVNQKIEKPKYKGPWKPPNRFGILPGYRWDGIDRGNGFEDRLNKTLNEKQSSKDEEYRWSTQDM